MFIVKKVDVNFHTPDHTIHCENSINTYGHHCVYICTHIFRKVNVLFSNNLFIVPSLSLSLSRSHVSSHSVCLSLCNLVGPPLTLSSRKWNMASDGSLNEGRRLVSVNDQKVTTYARLMIIIVMYWILLFAFLTAWCIQKFIDVYHSGHKYKQSRKLNFSNISK